MMDKNSSRSEQGRKNKAAGVRFERKVRVDLESKGWIVAKWTNNVDLFRNDYEGKEPKKLGMLISAKNKFRGPGIPMALGTGFPDFIVYRWIWNCDFEKAIQSGMVINSTKSYAINGIEDYGETIKFWEVIGVEVKSKGYLTKEEKAKCKWLLANNIFSKILIAKKGSKRGEIIYEEFK